MKHIQVFLNDEDSCEVTGILVSCVQKDDLLIVKHKEEGFTQVWENWFPLSNIHMIRISKYEKD